MAVEEVYICDKLEGLNDVKPATRPCRRAVNDVGGVGITLTIYSEEEHGGQSEPVRSVRFCSPTHANFWLSRQRVPA